jgi:transposase
MRSPPQVSTLLAMSTLKKIIPTTRHIAKPRLQSRQTGAESFHTCVEGISLACEKTELERKLRFQVRETDRARDDANKWIALYHKESERLEKAEGLLSLRNAEIVKLKAKIAKKDGQIKELQKKVFCATSEKGGTAQTKNPPGAGTAKPNKRGKQKGAPGAGRNKHENLPIGDEITYPLPDEDMVCAACGEAEKPVGFEESHEIEVEVKAYRRKHRRQKVGHYCHCAKRWLAKTAPVPPKLVKKGGYGISFWIFFLLGKFVFHTPLNRLCLQLAMKGLPVSAGTIVGGFKRIHELLAPLITEIKRYSREEKHHWHIDDTGWKVFVQFDGKTGHRWYLWVFLSNDVCVYILSPWRSRAVPKSHLEHSVGVATGDRLEANKKLGDNVQNSYCWVHIRRDLRILAGSYPEIADICNNLLIMIGSLYFLNAQRLFAELGSPENLAADKALRANMDQIKTVFESNLAKPNLHPELKRVFTGLTEDWAGLIIFMDLPEIPPDNNPAERALRGPVVGRKNYSGSSSEWSGHFSAAMFTLNETLKLNKVNTEAFLLEYLQACALNGGLAPPNAKDYLPWNRHLLPEKTQTSLQA